MDSKWIVLKLYLYPFLLADMDTVTDIKRMLKFNIKSVLIEYGYEMNI
jgi:hypothetical protein